MPLAQGVSEIPDAYERGNLSSARLLAETGHVDKPQQLTVTGLEAALAEYPEPA